MLVDCFKRFDETSPLVLGRDVDRLAEVSAQRLLDHLRAGAVLHGRARSTISYNSSGSVTATFPTAIPTSSGYEGITGELLRTARP